MSHGNGIEKYISREQKLKIMRGDVPPWMLRHIRADYIIKSFLSAPLWMTSRDLAPLRKEADRLTAATGIKHTLDHRIPITHDYVCGLTVPANIRVVPAAANAWKSNKWSPDQMEFFLQWRDPEQLALWDAETRARESGMTSKQRRSEEKKRIRNEGYWSGVHDRPRGNNPYTEAQDMAQWDIGYQQAIDERNNGGINPKLAARRGELAEVWAHGAL